MKIANSLKLKRTIQVPGDKSISHRSIMMGAIAEGKTKIRGSRVCIPGQVMVR